MKNSRNSHDSGKIEFRNNCIEIRGYPLKEKQKLRIVHDCENLRKNIVLRWEKLSDGYILEEMKIGNARIYLEKNENLTDGVKNLTYRAESLDINTGEILYKAFFYYSSFFLK